MPIIAPDPAHSLYARTSSTGKRANSAQGANQHAGATDAANADEHGDKPRAGAGASEGSGKGGEPPLGYNRTSFVFSSPVDVITPHSRRVYTDEERASYAARKRQENFERAHIARRWIAEDTKERNPDARLPAICSCGCPVKHKAGQLYINTEGVIYHDHKKCREWACPVCAIRNAYERASDIETAIIEAHRRGYKMAFVTYTIPHTRRQSCATVYSHIQTAYSKLPRGKRYSDFLSSLGYIAQIKTVDYTYTENGWHVHFHCVYFFDTSLDPIDLARQLASPADGLPYFWDRAVFRETGKHISFKHGLDVEAIELAADTDEQSRQIAAYVAKVISVYAANPDKDKGSLTPFDLLDDGGDLDESNRRRLFLEWYHAQFGRQRITFSANFKRDILRNKEQYVPPERASLGVISSAAVVRFKVPDVARAFYDLLRSDPFAADKYLNDIDCCSFLSSDALLALSSGMSPAELVDYLNTSQFLVSDAEAVSVDVADILSELDSALCAV